MKATNDPWANFDWTRVSTLQPGDRVSWWGQAAEVRKQTTSGRTTNLTVFDQVTGKEKTFEYQSGQELSACPKDKFER
ncbi:MAG: hypothetical protein ACAI38_00745 [Myxococcota bacterium]